SNRMESEVPPLAQAEKRPDSESSPGNDSEPQLETVSAGGQTVSNETEKDEDESKFVSFEMRMERYNTRKREMLLGVHNAAVGNLDSVVACIGTGRNCEEENVRQLTRKIASLA